MNFQETWLDKKGWEVIEGKLSKEYTWVAQKSKRYKIKERNIGGTIA